MSIWTPFFSSQSMLGAIFAHIFREFVKAFRYFLLHSPKVFACAPASFTSATPRRNQARSEMQLLHLGLGRHLGHFPVGLARRACLTSLSLGILDIFAQLT